MHWKRVLLVGGASSYLAYLIFKPDPNDIPYVPTPGLKYVNQRPAPLVPGTVYYGRADVSWPASWAVTALAIQKYLAAKGFTGIQVWTDAADLPVSWPAGERNGDRFVEATYPSTAAATTMTVPNQVLSIWS
jgi:hypothetical protein